jgi:signal transduction histidine kinase
VLDVKTGTVAAARGPAAVLAALDAGQLPDMTLREDVDGFGRAYASAWTSDRSCRVIVGLPRRMAWERTLPIYRRNALNAGAWYLLSFAALYYFLARWIRSVRHLEAAAARVSAGDLRTPAIQPMATRELEQMQRTMAEMVTRVRELQNQVVRQERLAAIGTLVSGVAHEISNPLQSILGSAQVIQALPDLPLAVHADLTVIQQEGRRASAIIRNLSRFTRQQPSGPVPIRMADIVQWLTELWRKRLEEQGITLDVDDQATRVTDVVAGELQQVALNFLVNAEYAVLHGDHPLRRVIVRTRDVGAGGVRFEVEDSGPGVPAKDESKLFQPFFTTKPVGDGTGLGLSVSYGIIQSYGGSIGYDRGTMGGARFFFEIPAHA